MNDCFEICVVPDVPGDPVDPTEKIITITESDDTPIPCDVAWDYNQVLHLDLSDFGGSCCEPVGSDADVVAALDVLGVTLTPNGCDFTVTATTNTTYDTIDSVPDLKRPTPYLVYASGELTGFNVIGTDRLELSFADTTPDTFGCLNKLSTDWEVIDLIAGGVAGSCSGIDPSYLAGAYTGTDSIAGTGSTFTIGDIRPDNDFVVRMTHTFDCGVFVFRDFVFSTDSDAAHNCTYDATGTMSLVVYQATSVPAFTPNPFEIDATINFQADVILNSDIVHTIVVGMDADNDATYEQTGTDGSTFTHNYGIKGSYTGIVGAGATSPSTGVYPVGTMSSSYVAYF